MRNCHHCCSISYCGTIYFLDDWESRILVIDFDQSAMCIRQSFKASTVTSKNHVISEAVFHASVVDVKINCTRLRVIVQHSIQITLEHASISISNVPTQALEIGCNLTKTLTQYTHNIQSISTPQRYNFHFILACMHDIHMFISAFSSEINKVSSDIQSTGVTVTVKNVS